MEEMKDFIVLCGISHSGKSSYAEKLKKEYPDKNYIIINTDLIREELHGNREIKGSDEYKVWDIFENKKNKVISVERNIILDACHISSQARWHSLRHIPNAYKNICILFDVTLKELKNRVDKTKRIDFEMVIRMDSQFHKPTKKDLILEGFDKVIIIK